MFIATTMSLDEKDIINQEIIAAVTTKELENDSLLFP